MASIRERSNAFAPQTQLPHWSSGIGASSDPNRPIGRSEPLRPIEPGESQNILRPSCLPARLHDETQISQRQQLPGVQELLSPSVRTGPRSPGSASWAPVNNAQSWHDRFGGSARSHSVSHIANVPVPVQPSPYRPRMEMPLPDAYRQPNAQNPGSMTLQRLPSMPVLPLRQHDISITSSHDAASRGGEYTSSPSYHALPSLPPPEATMEASMDRRPSLALPNKITAANSLFSLQIVGQRDIPGEGLCYVFKDGSTCPTVIDGEAVNPLWGTTKAGKARKRLAQACLNCREKKIKCEPGETSCLQCEKAKRECLRPSTTQSQAEMAAGATLAMSNNSPDHRDWAVPTSPKSTSTNDIPPPPKRRRSAHIAQQESAFMNTPIDDLAENEPKRRKSDRSSSIATRQFDEPPRKDSKRTFMDDESSSSAPSLVAKPDVLSLSEDPYRLEPDGTMLFLDLFFAQSAREARILFPRHAFMTWVRTCDAKCQRECMVLYAVLAVGSAFSTNEYSSFARLCVDRGTAAAANQYGRFSLALVHARLLLAVHAHLKGKEGLAWDYNGSALRAIGAMRLNTEEGCGEDLDEYARPYYSFTHEQLRECRRRTFWAAFLMDRYNGFCSALMNTINEDDVHIRLPCNENIYEDGSSSPAPFFEASGITMSDAQSPVAYTIAISVLWKEVAQFVYRSAHHPPSMYAARYESFLGSIQGRLAEWNLRLPHYLKYGRENLDRAIHHDYAGDYVSLHTLYLFSNLKVARMARHELLTPQTVARNICAAHSHALQLLAFIRDIKGMTLPMSQNSNRKTTDFMSSFIAYAVTSAIDTVGAGGLREEVVATRQVLSTAVEVLRELSRHCHSARVQHSKAERRLIQIESCPTQSDIRPGRGTDGRCWRITEPIEKALTLQQDVIYGVSSATFCEALAEGRRQ